MPSTPTLPCDMCCLHNYCVRVGICQVEGDPYCAQVVAAIKEDFARNRAREFLRVVEARKLDAEPVELQILQPLEDYLRAALDPEVVPTDMRAPGWFEERANEGDYDS